MPSYKLTEQQYLEIKEAIVALKHNSQALDSYLKKIRPLVRKDGILYEIEMPDPFDVAFTWDPELLVPADVTNLKVLTTLHTYHLCGYHMFIKPSVGEVYAQIPQDVVQDVVAFECFTDDGSVEIIDHPGWYGHKLTTVLYGEIK